MRLDRDGLGRGSRVVRRALCDGYTPNQWWLRYGEVIGLGIFLVFLVGFVAYIALGRR